MSNDIYAPVFDGEIPFYLNINFNEKIWYISINLHFYRVTSIVK